MPNNIQYTNMTDEALRQYFLQHKEDKNALQEYLNRRSNRPRSIITKVGDPDFDQKIQAAVLKQLGKVDSQEQPNN